MDRQLDFTNNFKKALTEIFEGSGPIDFSELRFKLTPIEEINKPNNLGGDWFISRKWLRKNPSFEINKWSLEEVLDLLSTNNNFPLWAEIERKESTGLIIEVKFSKRFRKYRDLHNKEHGYPPFKVLK